MINTLAVFYNENNQLDSYINQYIYTNYRDYFYIVNGISINNTNNNYAIMHYTDVRLRNIDILVTNIQDINKIKGFQNRILYYINTNHIVNTEYEKYASYLEDIDMIIYNKKNIKLKIIRDVLSFSKEVVDVSQYD